VLKSKLFATAVYSSEMQLLIAQVATDVENRQEMIKDSEDKVHQNNRNAGFGGMKKGFLFGSCSKTSSASKTPNSLTQLPKHEDIPFIKAKKDVTDSQHRFDAVQQAMQINEAFAMNKGDLFCQYRFMIHVIVITHVCSF